MKFRERRQTNSTQYGSDEGVKRRTQSMKKIIVCMSVVLISLIVIFGVLYIRNLKTDITPQAAIENVKNMLDDKSKGAIINFDSPEIEEVVFDEAPSIHYLGNKTDVIGKSLYKITFRTTQDGLLGPMVIYVDKANGKIIGKAFRY